MPLLCNITCVILDSSNTTVCAYRCICNKHILYARITYLQATGPFLDLTICCECHWSSYTLNVRLFAVSVAILSDLEAMIQLGMWRKKHSKCAYAVCVGVAIIISRSMLHNISHANILPGKQEVVGSSPTGGAEFSIFLSFLSNSFTLF